MPDSVPPAADDTALPACPYCPEDHPPERLKCPNTDMPLPLRGRVLAGRFRFIRRLGKGGMASVWLALNTSVDREVAIKLLRSDVLKHDSLVARFRSEAKAAGRIGHPNVCEILDYGVGPIGPYIIMECLRGQTLAQLIRERGRLSTEDSVAIVLEALDGLEAAHERGIVHRDLKPENVFLHQPATGPRVVKLMDFGIAKFTDGTGEITTEHGALLGTPEYMAPEQFKGADNAEARSDIWAVGGLLYRALTGRHPFKGPTVAATLLMVTHDDAAPIHDVAPEVPQALVDLVARCMAKRAEDRPETVAEVREALLNATSSSPTTHTLDRGVSPPDGRDESELDLERRPTEAYRVPAPPSPTPWARITIGIAVMLVASVGAITLWPSTATTPEPVTTALVPPSPSKRPNDDPALMVSTRPAVVVHAGAVDIGEGWAMAETIGDASDHGEARKFCGALIDETYAGLSGWKLPFPGLVERIVASDHAPGGTFWTSARWRGNVTVFDLPEGTMRRGVDAGQGVAQALCVAELPTGHAPGEAEVSPP